MKEKLHKKLKQAIDSSKFYGQENALWELVEELERFIDERVNEKLREAGIK